MLDVMADQLESTCKQLEQQYGEDKVLMLLCDVTDSKKLVGDLVCCLKATIHGATFVVRLVARQKFLSVWCIVAQSLVA